MGYLEAILYGAIQGLTEYLPISSSAHLILLPKVLGTADPGLAFDVYLHLGTLIATLVYFRKDWMAILRTVPYITKFFPETSETSALSWKLIVLATIPALIAGAVFHHWVETVLRGLEVIAVTLAVGGALLFALDRWCPDRRSLRSISKRDAVWVGLAQCLALIPGVSRSGATIAAGRVLGFNRAEAARFSFLISAPITAAAVIFELRNWDQLLQGPSGIGPLFVACLSSFLFGCLAIGGLLKLLKHFSFLSFALYRVCLGVVIWQLFLG